MVCAVYGVVAARDVEFAVPGADLGGPWERLDAGI
jgi:hypothetical protein